MQLLSILGNSLKISFVYVRRDRLRSIALRIFENFLQLLARRVVTIFDVVWDRIVCLSLFLGAALMQVVHEDACADLLIAEGFLFVRAD